MPPVPALATESGSDQEKVPHPRRLVRTDGTASRLSFGDPLARQRRPDASVIRKEDEALAAGRIPMDFNFEADERA